MLAVAAAACQAVPLSSDVLTAPLDPIVRHPFVGGATSVAGTVEQVGSCVGMRRGDTGDWAMLLWPESATTMAGGGLPQIRMGTTVLTVDAPAEISGFWAVGGTEPWTFLETHHIRSRCPASDYFFLTELATP